MEKMKMLKLQARDLPHCQPCVMWDHWEQGRAGKGLGQERRARDQRPRSGTLRCGGPTIFRPMYSQPGRTDSRKAFLWAPPENRVWSQGASHPHLPLQQG